MLTLSLFYDSNTMRIPCYLNDNHSITNALAHLIGLFKHHRDGLSAHINYHNHLELSFGEILPTGQFREFKMQKRQHQKVCSSEKHFFETAASSKAFEKQLTIFLNEVTLFNRRTMTTLKSDKYSFFGLHAAIGLCMNDPKHIPALIHFLSSVEMNYEGCLSQEINRIYERHQCTPDTLELLAARSSLLKGRHGHIHLSELLTKPALKELTNNCDLQNLLLKKITEYALMNYSLAEGQMSPREIITDALAPFRFLSEEFNIKCEFLTNSFEQQFPSYLDPDQHQSTSHQGFR